MPKRAKAAAVYARISSDQEGTALGVARQVEDCRRLADDLGWSVAEEYVDNDLSAWGGKRRPAYERMLDDLAEGRRDGVVVYHQDRLTRRPVELEHFVDVLTKASVGLVQFVAGAQVDVASGDGLLVLRVLGAVAANESASKSRRVRRKMDEVAAAGRPHGGSRRPFGFEDDRITHRPDEAAVICVLAERFLAGESIRSLATWLEEQGIKTVQGGPWRTPTLSGLLASPRNAGLRQHRGEVICAAVWEPIISPQTRDRIVARQLDRAVTGRRSPRRYLLSGLLRCGRCDTKLYSSARQSSRRYVCLSGPDHGGCGRLTVVADPLEDLIARAVLHRLDSTDLAAALDGRTSADAALAGVAESIAEDRAQLEELAAVYAAKDITMREWLTARKAIEARIADAERRLARSTRTDALAGLPGHGARLATSWSELNLTRQHAIVAAVMDRATILPGTGARTFDPDRVKVTWRL